MKNTRQNSRLVDLYLSGDGLSEREEMEFIVESFENLNEGDIENITFPADSNSFGVVNILPTGGDDEEGGCCFGARGDGLRDGCFVVFDR